MLAIVRDPVDRERLAPDHEIDVRRALVDARPLRRVLDRMVVSVTEGDVALQAAANWYFRGLEGRMLPADMMALYARFGQDAGLAANYTLCRWVMDRY